MPSQESLSVKNDNSIDAENSENSIDAENSDTVGYYLVPMLRPG